MSIEEIWKDIAGYEGIYQVSNLGRIKSLPRNKIKTERILKNKKQKSNGYCYISLCKNGKVKECRIHKLVAQAFLENPNNYDQIDHIDGDKENNKLSNLRWCNSNMNMNNINTLRKRSYAVLQYDKDMNFIKRYFSSKFASKETGICRNKILAVCRKSKHRKTAGGYIWLYEKDILNPIEKEVVYY